MMKGVGAQWLAALYDRLSQKEDIITNGFRKVGITKAVRQSLASTEDQDPAAEDIAEDPFEDH